MKTEDNMDNSLDLDSLIRWFDAWVTAFDMHRAELTELDRRLGDGDFGTNLIRPLEAARTSLASGSATTVQDVFATIASALMRAGGSSGPLLGSWFRELGRAGGSATVLGMHELAAGVVAGAAKVQSLGGAQVGDCTMVDAMAPAGVAFEKSVSAGETLAAALGAAAEAARAGASATADLVATRGRASYVGELGRGVEDPGAVAMAMFFEAGAAIAI